MRLETVFSSRQLLPLLLLVQAALAAKSPVVLVPGDGGSQVWASLRNTNNHWYCERSTSSPTLLWLQLVDLAYPAVNCLAYNLRLKFDLDSGVTRDNDGVNIIVPGFGNTETVEWLSNVKVGPTGYYHKLVDHLVNNFGYIRGVDVLGAPFDFRKAPNELSEYFVKLTHLVEAAYANNGNKSVVLVGHSLGCKVVLHFLHTKSQAWKQKYVKVFVAAAGPFGGAASSLRAAISGYNLGLEFIKESWFRDTQRSWPSTYYLVPSSLAFDKSMTIVSRPGRNYTLSEEDLRALFVDMGHPDGYRQYQLLGNVTEQTLAPGVPTVCTYGHGVKTARQFRWRRDSDFPDEQPEVTHGDGDGTVNIASLDVCLNWQRSQRQSVRAVPMRKVDHLGVIRDSAFLQLVADLATQG